VLTARLVPAETSVAALRGKRVLAFAGIGDPQRFFRTLRHADVDVAVEKAFADHHPYTSGEIDALALQAKRDGLTPVTTEKDAVKLRNMPAAAEIVSFAVTLVFEDKAALQAFVIEKLNQARVKTLGR
jgi:tetraacyldisaccharide 4'-kinase